MASDEQRLRALIALLRREQQSSPHTRCAEEQLEAALQTVNENGGSSTPTTRLLLRLARCALNNHIDQSDTQDLYVVAAKELITTRELSLTRRFARRLSRALHYLHRHGAAKP